MKIIDLHCDALLQLQQATGKLRFTQNDQMHVTYEKLIAGGVKVQAFALFIDPHIVSEDKFATALEQVAYFQTEVVAKHEKLIALHTLDDIMTLSEDEIGVFLTLESVECIGNDIKKLIMLLDAGVLSVGLTWNGANLACDGILEPRNAGLSSFGYEIIDLLNQRNILLDVSHISECGFNDVVKAAKYLIASHSNARAICSHPRNLTNEQIECLIRRKAMIHLVYAPQFLTTNSNAVIEDLLLHIDHIMKLGGVDYIGLGSDFDGITQTPKGLEDASHLTDLVELLVTKYGIEIATKITSQNFKDYLLRMR